MGADHWMNWDVWRWIAPPLSMAIGFYFGWNNRGWHERHKAFMRDHEDWMRRCEASRPAASGTSAGESRPDDE